MGNSSLTYPALVYAMAALANDGSGGGGGTGGTISLQIGKVETLPYGEQCYVTNVGTAEEQIWNIGITAGKDGTDGIDGLAGSRWFTSSSKPGTAVEGMTDGDYVVYSGGQIWVKENGTLKNTSIDISGSKMVPVNTPPSSIVPVGFKSGDCIIFNDLSIYRVVSGVLVNTGLNIKGPQGDSGFSPTITIKEDTEDTYILTITTSEGSFDTPNLKGTGTSPSTSMNPYQYAVMLGYEGSKSDFDQIYLSLLSGIIDGGNINGETSDIPGIGTGEVGDISTTELDPYAYAQSIGYTGTKEQFDEIYMGLLSGIVDGGLIEVLMKMAKSKQGN